MQFSGLPIGLDKLIKIAKRFKKEHKKVFDIVLYGSTTIGKEDPNDFDFMLLLKNAKEDDRFDLAFEFKQKLLDLGFPHEKLDVKAINVENLFDPNFLATPGIIIEGFSLTKGEPMYKLMNGESYALFVLTLLTLDRNEKTKFQFALKGRNGPGVLEEVKGDFLGPWVFLIPIENTYKFKQFLDYWKVHYEIYLMFGIKSSIRKMELI